MNTKYEAFFHYLKLDQRLIDCAMGRINMPLISIRSPAEWFVFPPVLAPIWSNCSTPSYVGIWNHWFSRREFSFVSFDVESGNICEIARTADQLFCVLIVNAICTKDG